MNKRRALLMTLLGGCVPVLRSQGPDAWDTKQLALSADLVPQNYTALQVVIKPESAANPITCLDLELPADGILLRLTVGDEVVTITAKEALAILQS